MTNPGTDANSLLMGGGESGRFARLKETGDQVDGIVIDFKVRQETAPPKPGQTERVAKTYPSGDPIMEVLVRLQTTLDEGPDDKGNADDGVRLVTLGGGTNRNFTTSQLAFRDAAIKAGAPGLEKGGRLILGIAGRKNTGAPIAAKEFYCTYFTPETVATSPAALGAPAQSQQADPWTAPPAATPPPVQPPAAQTVARPEGVTDEAWAAVQAMLNPKP